MRPLAVLAMRGCRTGAGASGLASCSTTRRSRGWRRGRGGMDPRQRVREVELVSDSRYLVGGMSSNGRTGWAHAAAEYEWRTTRGKPLANLGRRLLELEGCLAVTWRHVRGHRPKKDTSDDARYNREVDALAGELVRGIDLVLQGGEALALVGESGSGKTTAALGLIGYARPGTQIVGGTILFEGEDLRDADAVRLRSLYGGRIALVPQNPSAALNPALRVYAQFSDLMRAHGRDPTEATIGDLLASVSLPSSFARRYPHQLSGGQQQRLFIAMAMACDPALIVLDEPTTGLDVTTQRVIVELISRVRRERRVALIYISHDLAVVSSVAEVVAVMYGGVIVERGPREAIFDTPAHPYTRLLLDAIPHVDGERSALVGIPGRAIGTRWDENGCVFADRCPFHAPPVCDETQDLIEAGDGHVVRCARAPQLPPRARPLDSGHRREIDRTVPALEVLDVTATYGDVKEPAVSAATFSVHLGECVALVGESGSGKSTLARCIAGLHREWTGEIRFETAPLAHAARARPTEARQRLQIVFQNPDRSLNPRKTVGEIIGRPCRQLLGYDAKRTRSRVRQLLDEVSLPARYSLMFPRHLSGGERQRVAIARALAAEPQFIVCDEITSALDVSVQASLLELLEELQAAHGLSLLFITHDLGVVRSLADRVVVMQNGLVKEISDADRLFDTPRDAYTRDLLAAAPRLPRSHPSEVNRA